MVVINTKKMISARDIVEVIDLDHVRELFGKHFGDVKALQKSLEESYPVLKGKLEYNDTLKTVVNLALAQLLDDLVNIRQFVEGSSAELNNDILKANLDRIYSSFFSEGYGGKVTFSEEDENENGKI